MIEDIENAYTIIRDFKYLNPITKLPNKFEFEYSVPKVSGIIKTNWGKDLNSVKPSTLDYILYYLHDADCTLIFETAIAYFYYWKIRKKDKNKFIDCYKKLKEHYSVNRLPQEYHLENELVVYYISWFVGSIKVYKVGYSDEPIERFQHILAECRRFYPNVSVGDFEIIQLVKFNTKEQASAMESETLSWLKNKIANKEISKSKIYIKNGGTEMYMI